ncbi:MAG TPA: Dna2/Cas4 domain-containing protein [Pseudoneobacillus sp.]|nr:Dna2/Cas4 domain-containing protein [Pseudoneobacillus sp.]
MGLVNIIHNSIIFQNAEESAKHAGGKFYPSSIGKCLRAIVLQMMGVQGEEIEPRGLSIMNNGTYFHERMEKTLTQAGIVVASELPLKNPELLISGRLDLIIKNFEEHKPNKKIIKLLNDAGDAVYEGPSNDVLIVELKSINDKGFQYLQKKNEPKEEHVWQLHLYMHMTGIHRGLLLYENKNDQNLMDYFVDYDKNIADSVMLKIKKAAYYYKSGKLPQCEFAKDSFQCKYCSYKQYCHSSHTTLAEIKASTPEK